MLLVGQLISRRVLFSALLPFRSEPVVLQDIPL
jgi:hypothetical protein